LNGLVANNICEIQVFTNDARISRSANNVVGFGDGNNMSAPADFSDLNNSPTDSTAPSFSDAEVGDSIIGTFTASAIDAANGLFFLVGRQSKPAIRRVAFFKIAEQNFPVVL